MHLYVLSTRHVEFTPSNGCVVELEDLLVQDAGATLIAPMPDPATRRITLKPVALAGQVADRVLMLIALGPQQMAALRALGDWRSRFGRVAVYTLDPWGAWDEWPELAPRDADAYFVPDERVAAQFRDAHGVPAWPVALGADVLRYGCRRTARPLDLVAYGRQDRRYLDLIERDFNAPASNRFVYLDTLAAVASRSFHDNRRLIWKLLHKSRASLAFDVLHTPAERPGARYRSIIPIRYYEAVTAGTLLVGRHPVVPEMATQFGWTDAVIELPDSPDQALALLRDLLDDAPRLDAIHLRNHAQAWRLHDWRYRVRDMFRHLGVALPGRLARQLQILAGEPLDCAEVPWD